MLFLTNAFTIIPFLSLFFLITFIPFAIILLQPILVVVIQVVLDAVLRRRRLQLRSSRGDSRPQIPIVLFVVRFVILLVSVPNFQNFWDGNFLLFRLFVFFRQHLFVFFVQLFVRVRHFSRNDLVLRDGVWIADDRQLLRHFDRTVPVRALRDRSHGGVFLIVVVFLSRQK